MIKAVIFDLNGIFIQSPKLSDRFQEEFGTTGEEFLPALKEIMAKVRKPNAGDSFEYWKPYLENWGIGLTRDQFFDFWFSAEKEVPELIDMARKIKEKETEIFILSNNFIERATYYKQNFDFLNELPKKIYYSWETGFVKPSPDAFKNLLKENNLKPEECIYFDNSEENIEIANGLGIKAFLFEDVEGFKKILAEYQLI
jgi:putative hydrolase of the HAD superfamily